ncbi:CUB and sushi domain-containing protein 3-like isoform X2 [Antedon mediterranea]|uniref:CUB and sushi domain-containing protein 3-like isoform X2 n=1 Tax=Antedon mediterranea TaxID=105859 RepID=UPI003AF45FE3
MGSNLMFVILGLLLLHICTGFENLGCYYDYAENRTLPGLDSCNIPEPEEKCNGCAADQPYCESEDSMTIEFCHDLCHRRGFLYSGLEAGSQCFCGDNFDPMAPANGKPSSNNCTQETCTGDNSQLCGGELRIIMYKNDAFMNCTSFEFSNGTVTPNQEIYASQTTVTLTCNTGFHQVGPTESYCWFSGAFSHVTKETQPACIRECSALNTDSLTEVSRNVQYTGAFVVGDTITYECSVGYEPEGGVASGELECREDRLWSEALPTCNGVSCGDPGTPTNGVLNENQFFYPKSVSYSCNPGYVLSDSSTRQCQSDRNWSGSLPSCIPVDCGGLSNINNGEVSHVSGTTFGMSATYTCTTAGYELIGDMTRMCLEDGSWSGSTPSCGVVDCGDPGLPANGFRSGLTTTYNSVVSYICNTGYDIIGEQIITCQSDGTWTDNVPTCKIVNCGDPGTPVNGLWRSGLNTTYNSVVSYICETGYDLIGVETITCQANATWSDDGPTCQIVNCGDPGSPPTNGEMSGDSVRTYGSSVQYNCNTGYDITGSQSITCQADGTWSDSAPNCQIVDCMHPGSPDGITVEVDQTTYGEIVTYECEPGYGISSGNDWRMCGIDGSWSGEEPTCSISTCGEPESSEFSIRTGDSYVVGAIVTYQCMTGYEQTGGNAMITCHTNTSWSGEPIVCTEIPQPTSEAITTMKPSSSNEVTQAKSTAVPATTGKGENAAQTTGESDMLMMYIVIGISALLLIILILGATYILAAKRKTKHPLKETTSIEAIPNPTYLDGFAEPPMAATNDGFDMTEENEVEPTTNGIDESDGWKPIGHLESETSGGKFKPKFMSK